MNEFVGQFHTVIVLLLFVGALYLLTKATDLLVESAVTLSLKLGLSQMIIGATVLSLGTTLPEVSSSVIATLQGNSQFGLGNAIGSIITNTTLVLGLGAVTGMMPVKKESRAKLTVLIIAATLFILGSLPGADLFESGYLPQWMGFLFLISLPLYIWFLLKKEPKELLEEVEVTEEPLNVVGEKTESVYKKVLLLIIASIGVSFSAALLVSTAEVTAMRLGISDVVIASTIVAFGTSVPEVSTTLVAVRYGHGELAIGNVIGANIMNLLLVMGATISLMSGGQFIPGSYYILQFPVIIIIISLLSYLVFHPTKQSIAKREGAFLLVIYSLYLLVNFFFI